MAMTMPRKTDGPTQKGQKSERGRKPEKGQRSPEPEQAGLNVVVLRGRLSRPAELRVLPSGDRLVALEVSVANAGTASPRTESVPVVWHDAPAMAESLDVDQAVVVLGRVRRRFFRAGGVTQSRTEVVAEAVTPTRQAKRARALVAKAGLRLESVDTEAGAGAG